MDKVIHHARRTAIGVVGGVVVVLGIIAIPYPGPGWAIVFAGLAILATEFDWARRILEKVKSYYEEKAALLRAQPLAIRIAAMVLTGIITVATLWLFNAFGLVNDWLHLGQDWVRSPFVK